jgi:hypothetical protein
MWGQWAPRELSLFTFLVTSAFKANNGKLLTSKTLLTIHQPHH